MSVLFYEIECVQGLTTNYYGKICEVLHDAKITEIFGHFDQTSVRILKKITKHG